MPIISGSTSAAATGGLTVVSDTTLAVDTASFDITGIAATFAQLQLVLNLRMTGAVASSIVLCRFNNDSGANYDYQYGGANNASLLAVPAVAQTSLALGDAPGSTATAGYAATIFATIANYAGTTFDKTVMSCAAVFTGTAVANLFVEPVAGHWRTVGTAINRITITPSSGNWKAGCRCTIYGS